MSDSIFSMSDSVALITGASSGLGAHFAKVLANAGAKVVIAARRTEKLEALANEIASAGGEVLAVALDVTSTDSVNQALEKAEQSFGMVNVLINNAGVADSRRFVNTDESTWDFIMETNLKGSWRMAYAVSKRLLESGARGSIVNIASILGLRVSIGEGAYAASKAAVVQMTKAMALELANKDIRVNALCPGYFRTEINSDYFDSDKGKAYVASMPSRRLGDLSELDAPLLLLASDAGSFVNGIALPVDGGHLVSSL